MYTIDGVILSKDRIVIPVSLRDDISSILHSVYQRDGPMFSRTMSTLFWPRITAAVQANRNRCGGCHRNTPSQPNAPPYPVQTTEYPF